MNHSIVDYRDAHLKWNTLACDSLHQVRHVAHDLIGLSDILSLLIERNSLGIRVNGF